GRNIPDIARHGPLGELERPFKYVGRELGEYADHIAAKEQVRDGGKVCNGDKRMTPQSVPQQKIVEDRRPLARGAYHEMRIRKDGGDVELRPPFHDRMVAPADAEQIFFHHELGTEVTWFFIQPSEREIRPVIVEEIERLTAVCRQDLQVHIGCKSL